MTLVLNLQSRQSSFRNNRIKDRIYSLKLDRNPVNLSFPVKTEGTMASDIMINDKTFTNDSINHFSENDKMFNINVSNVPPYPLIGQSYDISVHINDSIAMIDEESLQLSVMIYFDDDLTEPVKNNFFVLVPSYLSSGCGGSVMINKYTGKGSFSLTLKELSQSHDNKRYIFKLFLTSTKHLKTPYKAPPSPLQLYPIFTSIPMTCVQYSLQVRIINDHHNTSYDHKDGVWYKDESGRDKSIDLLVTLTDAQHSIITTRLMALSYVLVYYPSLEPVGKQDLILLQPDSKLTLEAGRAVMKFRINDVSKNHQKQLFSIMIKPNTVVSSNCMDVAPGYMDGIEVKSKRNKRVRYDPRDDGDSSAKSISMDYPLSMGVSQNENSIRKHTTTQLPPSAVNLSRRVSSDMSMIHHNNPNNNLISQNSHNNSSTMYHNDSNDHRQSTAMSIGELAPMPTLGGCPSDDHNHNSPAAIDALLKLKAWMNDAVNSMIQMRWIQIGMESVEESMPRGSKTHRPIFEMTNPNSRIDRLLNQYHENIAGCMDIVAKELNHSSRVAYEEGREGGHVLPLTPTPSLRNNGNISNEGRSIHGYHTNFNNNSNNSGNNSDRMGAVGEMYRNQEYYSNFPMEIPDGSRDMRPETTRRVQDEGDWAMVISNMEKNSRMSAIDSYAHINGNATPSSSSEEQVFYVTASIVTSRMSSTIHNTTLTSESHSQFDLIIGSFCAFDVNKRLVGFYKEMLNEYNITIIAFRPLYRGVGNSNNGQNSRSSEPNRNEVYLAPPEVLALEMDFERKLLDNPDDPNVFSLNRCQFNLEKMKQECLVQFWLAEVSLLDNF